MAKQEVNAVQIQMAAAAGCRLLEIKDLPVPLEVAKSGALGVLEGMLQALANGEVVLTNAPDPNATVEVPAKPPLTPGLKEPAANNGEGSDDDDAAGVEQTG